MKKCRLSDWLKKIFLANQKVYIFSYSMNRTESCQCYTNILSRTVWSFQCKFFVIMFKLVHVSSYILILIVNEKAVQLKLENRIINSEWKDNKFAHTSKLDCLHVCVQERVELFQTPAIAVITSIIYSNQYNDISIVSYLLLDEICQCISTRGIVNLTVIPCIKVLKKIRWPCSLYCKATYFCEGLKFAISQIFPNSRKLNVMKI